MTFSKKIIGIAIIVAAMSTAVAAYTFLINGNDESKKTLNERKGLISGITIIQHDKKQTKTFHYDVLAFDNIKDLVNESKCIVVGDVIKKSSNTRNLSRDIDNPNEEAKDRKCMSQEYEFKVLKWLKGSGKDSISIVYPDYVIDKQGTEPGSSVSLKEGKRYVLFLTNGIEDTYCAPAEPWQFRISSKTDNNYMSNSDVGITIDTNLDGFEKMKDLKEMKLSELISVINKS